MATGLESQLPLRTIVVKWINNKLRVEAKM